MSVLPIIENSPLLHDLHFLRKFQLTQKRVEREVYGEYSVNRDALESKVERQFLAHPQELRFEGLDSSLSSSDSERKLPFSWSEQELKLHKEREKIHQELTQTKTVNFCFDARPKKAQQEKGKGHEERNMSAKTPKNVITDLEFDKKFRVCVDKSLHTINEIRTVMDRGIDPPDGEEDASRRLLRVKEFCNRFSRNYLYPIARQLECLSAVKSTSSITHQKLLTAYQIILNGLQAYLNHLPTSIGGCSADKLKMLLKYLLDLCEVHEKRDEKGDLSVIKSFKMNAELTLQKVTNHEKPTPCENVVKKSSTKSTVLQKKLKKPNTAKNVLSERLSMYAKTSSFRRDNIWRKTTENITQKKINVKSRYKTAVFKHRPQVEKNEISVLSLPSKCKLFPKKSSAIFKKTPLTTPVNEDNIETMVEMGKKREEVDENENKLEVNHEELVVRLLQLVLDKSPREKDESSKVANILDELRKEVNKEKLQKILNDLEDKMGNSEANKLELKVKDSPKPRKEPTITVSGSKNAKLICIKDDNSIVEMDDDIDPEMKDRSNEKFLSLKAVSSSQTQTDYGTSHKSTQRPPMNINMKKLKKSSKYLKMMPKNSAVNIIQYKLDFHKYCKDIAMYKKNGNIQPWVLMTRLSDKVLDLALLKVAQEIETNDIAAQIYRSELQL